MDPANRTLDSMRTVSDPSQLTACAETQPSDDPRPSKRRAVGPSGSVEAPLVLDEDGGSLWSAVPGEADPGRNTGKEVPESLCEFASILELRRAVKKAGNRGESSSDLVL
jgi:DNA mismatch repair protein MLH1